MIWHHSKNPQLVRPSELNRFDSWKKVQMETKEHITDCLGRENHFGNDIFMIFIPIHKCMYIDIRANTCKECLHTPI